MTLHRLFFAVRPDAEAGSMAVQAMRRQMEAHDLSGHHVALNRLHVTLHWLGDHEHELPPDLLRRAKDAGRRINMAPFSVGFDHIGSFGIPGTGGLALTGAAELKTLREFQRTLAASMEVAGIGHHIRRRFNPHVSLLYGDQSVSRKSIAPIRWRVDQLLLIDSLVGQGQHVDLERWQLQSRQLSLSEW